MRLHHRLPALALAAALALSLASCQTLAGKGGSPDEFKELKQALSDDRAGLSRALAAGEIDRASGYIDGIGTRFDEIWAKSSAMNLLDREHLAIQIASGRRMLTSIRQWVSSTDLDVVWLERSYHVATLDYDAQVIFDRSAEFIAKRAGN